jgi:Site-specific recombinase XerD
MASVSFRTNKDGTVTWRVRFRLRGSERQESFFTEVDATRFKKRVERDPQAALDTLARTQGQVADTPTLTEWTARYLDPGSGLLTGVEAGTRDGYRRIAERSFLPILGDLPVDVVTREDVGRWVTWQEGQVSARTGAPVAAKTVRNYYALLSNVFKVATEIRPPLRPDNPAHKVRLTRGTKREPVFLSRAEFAALYVEIPDYYKPLVAFLVGSQCRWSEATAVMWGDLSTDTNPPTVRVSKAWKRNPGGRPVLSVPKTRRSVRTIALWPELVALLGDRGPASELIFQGKLNRERVWYGSFNHRVWRPAVERALEKRPNIHDLRHTGASWLIADGAPLPFIQARLGHESITTTVNVYGHLLPDAHTTMAASLQLAMSNVLPIR